MAAPMNRVGIIIRGHIKRHLRLGVSVKNSFCSEATEVEEYEKKLEKIRDCSGLSSKLRKRHYAEMPDVVFSEAYKGDRRAKLRRLYAEVGASSGINPSIMYPSKAELEDLKEIERDWTPTFQQLKDDLEYKKEAEAEAARLRLEKVEKSMNKMDQLIAQYHQSQKKIEGTDKQYSEKTKMLLQEFRERYGFSVTENSGKFKMFRHVKAEENKEQKKKEKKEIKKEQSMKNLQAILKKQNEKTS